MPRVADYVIIRDGKASLQLVGPSGAKFWNFTVPSNIHLGSRAILMVKLHSLVDAVNFKYSILINN